MFNFLQFIKSKLENIQSHPEHLFKASQLKAFKSNKICTLQKLSSLEDILWLWVYDKL